MKYGDVTPPASISEYVDRILVIEDFKVMHPFTIPLFANGCPTLLFQTKKALLNKEPAGHFTMFGQTVKPGALTIAEDFTLIAYFFKPHALVSLFNVAGVELSDSYVDANLLQTSDIHRLQEQLLNSASSADMLSLLNKHISTLISRKKTDASKIHRATNLIRNNITKGSLRCVQENLYITEKTLLRMFEKHVGISPRLYKRICQFNAAFQQLSRRKFMKLTEIAYHNNYADQSHFVRSFREFTNITPSEYLNISIPAR
ncbi:MAG TPA: AraC family transcriptional regulator [Chitinophagaceae bacterium]|nr:AraC family transcriptional regulator [Chitinophagaceae bacterium]